MMSFCILLSMHTYTDGTIINIFDFAYLFSKRRYWGLFNCQSSIRRIREICGNMLGTSGDVWEDEQIRATSILYAGYERRAPRDREDAVRRYWVILRSMVNTTSP